MVSLQSYHLQSLLREIMNARSIGDSIQFSSGSDNNNLIDN